MVRQAQSFQGTPYVFGAATGDTKAFDCSSFVQYLYGQHGVNLPRVAYDQYKATEQGNVSQDQAQPGDLIFFKDTYDANNPLNISHVAVYQGNGSFIGAQGNDVNTDSLSNPYWANKVVAIHRVGPPPAAVSSASASGQARDDYASAPQPDTSTVTPGGVDLGGGGYGAPQVSIQGKMDPHDYVDTLAPVALEHEARTGIPAAYYLATGAHEGDWGSAGNTLFGIKGAGATFNTWESEGGSHVDQPASFRTYPSANAAFDDFDQLVTSGRYAPAYQAFKQSGDAAQFFKDITAAGYATDPEWGGKIERMANGTIAPILGQAQQGNPPSQYADSARAPGRAAPLPPTATTEPGGYSRLESPTTPAWMNPADDVVQRAYQSALGGVGSLLQGAGAAVGGASDYARQHLTDNPTTPGGVPMGGGARTSYAIPAAGPEGAREAGLPPIQDLTPRALVAPPAANPPLDTGAAYPHAGRIGDTYATQRAAAYAPPAPPAPPVVRRPFDINTLPQEALGQVVSGAATVAPGALGALGVLAPMDVPRRTGLNMAMQRVRGGAVDPGQALEAARRGEGSTSWWDYLNAVDPSFARQQYTPEQLHGTLDRFGQPGSTVADAVGSLGLGPADILSVPMDVLLDPNPLNWMGPGEALKLGRVGHLLERATPEERLALGALRHSTERAAANLVSERGAPLTDASGRLLRQVPMVTDENGITRRALGHEVEAAAAGVPPDGFHHQYLSDVEQRDLAATGIVDPNNPSLRVYQADRGAPRAYQSALAARGVYGGADYANRERYSSIYDRPNDIYGPSPYGPTSPTEGTHVAQAPLYPNRPVESASGRTATETLVDQVARIMGRPREEVLGGIYGGGVTSDPVRTRLEQQLFDRGLNEPPPISGAAATYPATPDAWQGPILSVSTRPGTETLADIAGIKVPKGPGKKATETEIAAIEAKQRAAEFNRAAVARGMTPDDIEQHVGPVQAGMLKTWGYSPETNTLKMLDDVGVGHTVLATERVGSWLVDGAPQREVNVRIGLNPGTTDKQARAVAAYLGRAALQDGVGVILPLKGEERTAIELLKARYPGDIPASALPKDTINVFSVGKDDGTVWTDAEINAMVRHMGAAGEGFDHSADGRHLLVFDYGGEGDPFIDRVDAALSAAHDPYVQEFGGGYTRAISVTKTDLVGRGDYGAAAAKLRSDTASNPVTTVRGHLGRNASPTRAVGSSGLVGAPENLLQSATDIYRGAGYTFPKRGRGLLDAINRAHGVDSGSIIQADRAVRTELIARQFGLDDPVYRAQQEARFAANNDALPPPGLPIPHPYERGTIGWEIEDLFNRASWAQGEVLEPHVPTSDLMAIPALARSARTAGRESVGGIEGIREALRVSLPYAQWYDRISGGLVGDLARRVTDPAANAATRREIQALMGAFSPQRAVPANAADVASVMRHVREMARAGTLNLDEVRAAFAGGGGDEESALVRVMKTATGKEFKARVLPDRAAESMTDPTLAKALVGYATGAMPTGGRALKTPSFGTNLLYSDLGLHDPESTMDTWMFRALGLDAKSALANPEVYQYANAIVQRIAREQGVTFKGAQAAIWNSVRSAATDTRMGGRWMLRKSDNASIPNRPLGGSIADRLVNPDKYPDESPDFLLDAIRAAKKKGVYNTIPSGMDEITNYPAYVTLRDAFLRSPASEDGPPGLGGEMRVLADTHGPRAYPITPAATTARAVRQEMQSAAAVAGGQTIPHPLADIGFVQRAQPIPGVGHVYAVAGMSEPSFTAAALGATSGTDAQHLTIHFVDPAAPTLGGGRIMNATSPQAVSDSLAASGVAFSTSSDGRSFQAFARTTDPDGVQAFKDAVRKAAEAGESKPEWYQGRFDYYGPQDLAAGRPSARGNDLGGGRPVLPRGADGGRGGPALGVEGAPSQETQRGGDIYRGALDPEAIARQSFGHGGRLDAEARLRANSTPVPDPSSFRPPPYDPRSFTSSSLWATPGGDVYEAPTHDLAFGSDFGETGAGQEFGLDGGMTRVLMGHVQGNPVMDVQFAKPLTAAQSQAVGSLARGHIDPREIRWEGRPGGSYQYGKGLGSMMRQGSIEAYPPDLSVGRLAPEQQALEAQRAGVVAYRGGPKGHLGGEDPTRWADEGLFGPAAYYTSDPRVAGQPSPDLYSSNKRGYAWKPTSVWSPDGRLLGSDLGAVAQNLRDTEGFLAEGRNSRQQEINYREMIGLYRKALEEGTGPSVRKVDVPSDLNLLDADAPLSLDAYGRIADALPPDRRARFISDVQGGTGQKIYNDLTRILGNDKRAANDVLQAAGYEGVKYAGGRRIPMKDATTLQPISHDAYAIFERGMPKVRNLLSGTMGGITDADIGRYGTPSLANDLGLMTPGGVGQQHLARGFMGGVAAAGAGAAGTEDDPNDPNARLRNAAVVGAAMLAGGLLLSGAGAGIGRGMAHVHPATIGKGYTAATDGLRAFYSANLMSNPASQVRNITSNVLSLATVPAESALATGNMPIARFLARASGAPTATGAGSIRNVTGELKPSIKGWKRGVIDGFSTFAEVMRNGAPSAVMQGDRLPATAWGGSTESTDALKTLLGPYLSAPFNYGVLRPMRAADEFFKSMVFHSSVNTEFYREAASHGMRGTAADGYVDQRFAELLRQTRLKQAPQGDMKAALERAGKFARYMTYQQEMDRIGTGLSAIQKVPVVGPLLMPFARTPYNILKFGFERSPLGAVPIMGDIAMGRYNPASKWALANPSKVKDVGDLADRLARFELGVGFFATATALYSNGWLTGAAPTDPGKAQVWRDAGNKEYSISLPNGYSIPFTQLPALGPTLVGVTSWQDALRDGRADPENDTTVKEMGKAFDGVTQAMTQTPWMQSWAQIAQAIDALSGKSGGAAEAFGSRATTVAGRAIGGLVPFSSLDRALTSTTDTTDRRQNGLLGPAQAVLPPALGAVGLPNASGLTPQERLGRPMPRVERTLPGALFNPLSVTQDRTDPLEREFLAQGMAVPSAGTEIAGQSLSADQRDAYEAQIGANARPTLERLVASPEYRAADPTRRGTMLQSVIDAARGSARLTLMSQGAVPNAILRNVKAGEPPRYAPDELLPRLVAGGMPRDMAATLTDPDRFDAAVEQAAQRVREAKASNGHVPDPPNWVWDLAAARRDRTNAWYDWAYARKEQGAADAETIAILRGGAVAP